MVDVLCAVEICRLAVQIRDGGLAARGIICVSRDMDLIPAYRFAEEMGVPCWVAARDTVHRRWADHRWLILDDGSLSTATSRQTGQAGHILRRAVAEASLEVGSRLTMSVKFVDRAHRKVCLTSNEGLLGYLPLSEFPDGVRSGRQLDVYPAGIELDGGRGDFPVLIVSTWVPTQENHETGIVIRWVSPTSIDTRIDNRIHRLDVPAGHLLPGMRILVQVGQKGEPRYIGPLESRPWTSSGLYTSSIMIANVVNPGRGSRRIPFNSDAIIESDGQSVVLAHETRWTKPGDRYPVFLAHAGSEVKSPRVMALGSALPRLDVP
jgi:hypothetical protein